MPFIPHVATLALMLIVASIIFAGRSAGLYLAGLFLVLIVSGALFFTLVVTLLDESEP